MFPRRARATERRGLDLPALRHHAPGRGRPPPGGPRPSPRPHHALLRPEPAGRSRGSRAPASSSPWAWASTRGSHPMVESAGSGRARVFDLGPLVDPILVPGGPIDPHFWLDPIRMQHVTDLVIEACRNLDPEGGPGFGVRGGEVKASLQKLHLDLARRSERWRGRRIMTFHGSLSYFARSVRLRGRGGRRAGAGSRAHGPRRSPISSSSPSRRRWRLSSPSLSSIGEPRR